MRAEELRYEIRHYWWHGSRKLIVPRVSPLPRVPLIKLALQYCAETSSKQHIGSLLTTYSSNIAVGLVPPARPGPRAFLVRAQKGRILSE